MVEGFLASMVLLFAFGTFAFWGLVVIESIIFIMVVENDWEGFGFLLIIVNIIILQVMSDIDPITNFIANPLLILKYLLYYCVIGVVWATIKYFFEVDNKRRAYKEEKEKYLKNHSEDEWLERLADRGSEYYCYKDYNDKPQIIFWMIYWPFSMFWTLLDDPIKRLFNYIFDVLKNMYRKMHNLIMNEAISDLEAARELAKKKQEEKNEPTE